MSCIASLKPFADALAKCSACGLCLTACPAYNASHAETDGPRGRVTLILALLQRQIEPEQTIAAFARCALCGQCEKSCPAALPLLSMFFTMRRILRPLLKLDRQTLLFFQLLAGNPKVIDFLQSPLALAQGYFLRRHKKNYPLLAITPLAGYARPRPKRKRAALFLGCLTRRFFPELGQMCIALLEKCNVEVLAQPELGCCGRPFAVQGRDPAKAVSRNLAVLASAGFDWLLTPCPGCLATIKNIWPILPIADESLKRQAREIAAKSQDIVIFLAKNLPNFAKEAPDMLQRKIFWHKPCLMEDAAASAALRFLGDGVAQSASRGQCCGASLACLGKKNAVAKKQPGNNGGRPELWNLPMERELSLREEMSGRILRQALAAGSSAIATACPGCMLELKFSLGKAKKALPTRHIVELIGKGRS